MGVFRPKLDIGAPKEAAGKGKASLDKDKLKAQERRAKKLLERARSRVESLENELLLSDDQDIIEDLRDELSDANEKKEKALGALREITKQIALIKAKEMEEVHLEEDLFEVPYVVRHKRGSKHRSATKGSKSKPARAPDDAIEEDAEPDNSDEASEPKIEPDEETPLECEVIDDDITPLDRSRAKRSSRWTPKRAIAIGVFLCLVLPMFLYGLVIPRVDLTVRTWYSEGFQNRIVVDSKIENMGTVDITNLDLRISVLKDVEGVEIFLTELDYDDPMIYPHSEQKIESLEFHDNQNDRYILLVQITWDAGGMSFDKSYTHAINKPYMSMIFEDNVFRWAL